MRKPFFIRKLSAWYVWINGQQVRLGKDRDAAFHRYHELMAEPAEINRSAPVVVLFDEFLEWCKYRRASSTYEWYRMHLESFGHIIGRKLTVAALQSSD